MLARIKKFGLWWESYKIFGPDEHTSDRTCIFSYREGDNNYSISMTIFGYVIVCFVAKTTEPATRSVL